MHRKTEKVEKRGFFLAVFVVKWKMWTKKAPDFCLTLGLSKERRSFFTCLTTSGAHLRSHTLHYVLKSLQI